MTVILSTFNLPSESIVALLTVPPPGLLKVITGTKSYPDPLSVIVTLSTIPVVSLTVKDTLASLPLALVGAVTKGIGGL